LSDTKRLIEVDFPLEQVSLDSVHEKNVRHGHISTLHIWPARRPLAACRAALIATLLADPGNAEERKAIYRRMAGQVVDKIEKKKINGRIVEVKKKETKGGILHWGRESGPDIDWIREKIREAYGGRAPKVLDPFAGGGAIPLEAMRLGCEATAIDINPVAWFILKCTLEYPQKLAGKTLPLPDFALKDREFMEAFLKAKGFKGKTLERQLAKLDRDERGVAEPALIDHDPLLEADLAWQVRAWGRWVLTEARKRLAHRYSTYAEFEALAPGGVPPIPRKTQLLESNHDGTTDVTPQNAGFSKAYLEDPRNPRWIAKPTVAYLWARTVRCKGCRATIPLLKTKWLVKKDNKRVLLTVTPNQDRTGVVFGIENDPPVLGGNAAQRREHDRRVSAGTMSRSGAQCVCCPTIMTMGDIRLEATSGRLGSAMTAVVTEGSRGKEYRLPYEREITEAVVPTGEIDELFNRLPYGIPSEGLPSKEALGFRVPLYGIDQWHKLFSQRQLLVLGHFTDVTRHLPARLLHNEDAEGWNRAIRAYLAICVDRVADRNSELAWWQTSAQKVGPTFTRWALPMTWDHVEICPWADLSGSYAQAVDWVAEVVEHLSDRRISSAHATALKSSAIQPTANTYDVVVTDPPYYDAIPYSDLMDFYYVLLRRCLKGLGNDIDEAFRDELGPKWNAHTQDGELIDDASRFEGNKACSKAAYEAGMARTFDACNRTIVPKGRMVVVFASKSPEAWETLVSAIIKAGFVVDGSWPIQTERVGRMRSVGSAALSSSIWLVCTKRTASSPGWDSSVLREMRARIYDQLRAFWDAGIRGPDFVWAATGPALEAFSKYPVIRKADQPNAQMTVSEFLREVRRIVVDFVVGQVFAKDGADESETESLDDVTTYYLLHRHDFRLDDAPIGACILYALSCNLSDSELADRYDILVRSGGTLFDEIHAEDDDADEQDDDEIEDAASGGKGNKVKLKEWKQRRGKALGYEAPGGKPVPMIDQAHRLMHLWRAGDEMKVEEYLDSRGLKRNELFKKVLQALIELSEEGSDERSTLESLSNHIASRSSVGAPRQRAMEI
jgi:adenine-specific DNA methylase